MFLQEIHESIEELNLFDLGIDVKAMHDTVEKVKNLFMDRKQRVQTLVNLPHDLNQITSRAAKMPVEIQTTNVYSAVRKWIRILMSSDSDMIGPVKYCPPSVLDTTGGVDSVQKKPILPPIDSQPLNLAAWVSCRPKTREENSALVRNDRKAIQKVICWWSIVREQLISALSQQEIPHIKKQVLQVQLEAVTRCLSMLKERMFSRDFILDFFSEIHESIDYLNGMGLGVNVEQMHGCVETFCFRFMEAQQRFEVLQNLLKELEKITECVEVPLNQTLIQENIETWILIDHFTSMGAPDVSHFATMDVGSLLPQLTCQPLSLVEWKSLTPSESEEDIEHLREVIKWWSSVEDQLQAALAKQEISSTKNVVLRIQHDVSHQCFSDLETQLSVVDQQQDVKKPCASASSLAIAPSVVDSQQAYKMDETYLEDYLLGEALIEEEMEEEQADQMTAPELRPTRFLD
jgi:hypothetical protein